MRIGARRLAVACVLSGGFFGFGAAAQSASAQSCDPAYVNYCVPPVSEVGDLNCDYFTKQGIYDIQLADPSNDPHGLDGWNYVDDGWACESGY